MVSNTKRKPRPKSRKRLLANFNKNISSSVTMLCPSKDNNTMPQQTASYSKKATTIHEQQKSVSFCKLSLNDNDDDSGDYVNSYSIIDKSNLLRFIENTICITCHRPWSGSIECSKREGLQEWLCFTCYNCGNTTTLSTSKQVLKTQRHSINIRAQLGAYLAGIGHGGLQKLCAALNLPPPLSEDNYSKTNEFLVPKIQACQQKSMHNAIEEAVKEAGGRELVISGDGTWLTRGRTSAHGVADLCSTAKISKIIDTERSSKRCSKCMGYRSIREIKPDEYEEYIKNHTCEINYDGASGSMERNLIHIMFKRSITKYNVKYCKYIGDGDAKVFKYLLDDPPYHNLTVEKIEDINHYAKRLLNRCKKLKTENKNKILEDGLKIGGNKRLTDQHIVKFKKYLAKAIRENKKNLNMMYQRAQAIFYHYYSTNQDPLHHYCDMKWCKYLQNKAVYDHDKHSIPRPCMDCIKPAFDELCSKQALTKVLHGGTQNSNEAFHAILWSMAPKHRYLSGTMLDIAIGLAVVLYNDGYLQLYKLFEELFGSGGYFTKKIFTHMDCERIHHGQKKLFAKLRTKQRKENEENEKMMMDNEDTDDGTSSDNSDNDEVLYSIVSSDEDAYEPGGDD
ncbi:unnamed protein product [Rotaria sp. Silwood1]|nr:unnamed protein product [Rotaria sp. Silwood1]CAF3915866.1 unnamed protein product [Rotaria sp. Silwood1]CAF4902499.1 unnamed protein product [Rotaria sp. Silwood1]